MLDKVAERGKFNPNARLLLLMLGHYDSGGHKLKGLAV